MKWIGQLIYDQIARFRNDVYLEDISTGTIASGGNLGLDSNNKIVKATISGSDGMGSGFTVSATTDSNATTITQGDDLFFAAGTGITCETKADGTVTITNTVSDTNTNQLTEFTLTGDSGSNQTIAHGNTLDIAGGDAISTVVGNTDTVTINHDDTSSQASVNNSGRTFIQDITLDTYGHVTGITSATDADTYEGVITQVRLATDSGTISDGTSSADFTIAGGEGIDTSATGSTITIAGELASTSNKGVASFSADNFAVADGVVTIKDEGVDLTSEVTGVLPSANLDADTAHYSAARQFTHHMMTDNIGTSTKVYIALQETDAESTSSTNKNLPFLIPGAGKLLKVLCRVGGDCSGATLTWTLETVNTSTNTASSPSVIGTQSGAGPTAKTMTTYDFTSSLDSGTNALSAGDTVQLGVEANASTGNFKWYITCVWEFDLG